jgi:hypothetical protein
VTLSYFIEPAASRRGWRRRYAYQSHGLRFDAGVPATSVTAFLIQTSELAERGIAPLPPGTVIVVDESSTTPTPHMAALADLAEGCDGKLVLIGDPRQIGAVGPGGLYGNLTNEIEPVVLTQIRRQRDPVDREIVELAHAGRGSDVLDVLRAHDRLVIADTLPEALDAQVLDWHKRYRRLDSWSRMSSSTSLGRRWSMACHKGWKVAFRRRGSSTPMSLVPTR